MFAQHERNADSSPLKRLFADVVTPAARDDPLLYLNHTEYHGQIYVPVRPGGPGKSQSAFSPHKRRSISISRSRTMPSQSGSATSAVFPSFMSIYSDGGIGSGPGLDTGHEKPLLGEQKHHTEAVTHALPTRIHHKQHPGQSNGNHSRRGSISSLASTSESTESSPTTTSSSTFDSPLNAEPSPSSSPETPSSALPGSSFMSMTKSTEYAHQNLESHNKLRSETSPTNAQQDQPFEHARNVKKLSLKPIQTILTRPTTSSSVESVKSFSTENVPLREILKTGRRKAPGLSIQTPGFAPPGFFQTTSDAPSTPGIRPSLNHVQSSPQFPTAGGSTGGLRLPLSLNVRGGHSRPGSDTSSKISFGNTIHDLKEEDQSLVSQEVVERGYPNGPIQIYDCGVYLYLEPTAEEASRFDTVINVAKEVKNPFDNTTMPESETVVGALRKEEERSQIPEPQTAISEISFKSAFEWPSSATSTTPTTPRASSMQQRLRPQYVHVPWDHNSEIVADLYPLCRLIDEQVDAGKKVLIHCQLGVSRSASLTIAYGLYKGYQTTFHAMYETVKRRSQWVGPNMTLIYQLNDFRSKVEKGNLAETSKAPPREWFKSQLPAGETTLTPLLTNMSTSALDHLSMPSPAVPAIARAPRNCKLNLNKQLPPVPPSESGKASTDASKASGPAVMTQTSHAAAMKLDGPPAVPPKPIVLPRPLPLRDFHGLQEIPPHRPQPAGITTARHFFPPSRMDLAGPDEPQTPSLFSPRATEFMASPFGRTQAGEIMLGRAPSITRPSALLRSATRDTIAPEVDPRAPQQTQEGGEIVRSIDAFL